MAENLLIFVDFVADRYSAGSYILSLVYLRETKGATKREQENIFLPRSNSDIDEGTMIEED